MPAKAMRSGFASLAYLLGRMEDAMRTRTVGVIGRVFLQVGLAAVVTAGLGSAEQTGTRRA